jgi:hypothetical protein
MALRLGLLLLVGAHYARGQTCPAATFECPGYYTNGDVGQYYSAVTLTCIPCPLGKYQDVLFATSCKSCPDGFYMPTQQSNLAAKHVTSCLPCPSGKFTVAVAGTATLSCTECPAGKYQTNHMQTSCADCQIARYQNLVAMRTCKHCGVGKWGDPTHTGLRDNTTYCINCPAGRANFPPHTTVCDVKCPANMATAFSSAGDKVCYTCPGGKLARPVDSINPHFFDQELGTHSITMATAMEWGCYECPFGKYSWDSVSAPNGVGNHVLGTNADGTPETFCKDAGIENKVDLSEFSFSDGAGGSQPRSFVHPRHVVQDRMRCVVCSCGGVY